MYAQGRLRDVPRLVPGEVSLVEKMRISSGTASDGWVPVSYRNLLRKRAPVSVGQAEATHEIGQRAGHEKVLLHKAQALPHVRGVVGIQDARERFGPERLRQGADKIAAA